MNTELGVRPELPCADAGPYPRSPWRPIETAPKDGLVLFWHPGAGPKLWHASNFHNVRGIGHWPMVEAARNFTHWMPIPEPPMASLKGQDGRISIPGMNTNHSLPKSVDPKVLSIVRAGEPKPRFSSIDGDD
jgi:hypothetical protein